MGMTNRQFQGFIRFILSFIKRIEKQVPDNEDVKELLDIIQSMLEDGTD